MGRSTGVSAGISWKIKDVSFFSGISLLLHSSFATINTPNC